MTGAISNLPFGGVGGSGTGNYRGRYSFDAFTHRRPVADTPSWLEALLSVRYMPYDMTEMQRIKRFIDSRPNFDRNGKQLKGWRHWSSFMFGLGAKNSTAALMRWVLVLFLSYTITAKRGMWSSVWR